MSWQVQPEWSEEAITRAGGVIPRSLRTFLLEALYIAEPTWHILAREHLGSIRLNFKDKLGFLSRRAAGPAPCWTWKETVMIRPGEWMRVGGTLDLSGPYGMAAFGHEVVHAIQYLERGLAATALNLWLPWAMGKQHADIKWEQDAIEVEGALRKRFATR